MRMPFKILFRVVLLAALSAALSAAADGFVISTNAIAPERRAMLAALCERLETCGLPQLPRGAEWTDAFDSGRSLPHDEFYFGEDDDDDMLRKRRLSAPACCDARGRTA